MIQKWKLKALLKSRLSAQFALCFLSIDCLRLLNCTCNFDTLFIRFVVQNDDTSHWIVWICYKDAIVSPVMWRSCSLYCAVAVALRHPMMVTNMRWTVAGVVMKYARKRGLTKLLGGTLSQRHGWELYWGQRSSTPVWTHETSCLWSTNANYVFTDKSWV